VPVTKRLPTWGGDWVQLSKLAADCSRHMLSVKGYSETTVQTYELTWRQFLAYLIGLGCSDDLRHFTIERVEGFARYLAEHGLHVNTISYRLGHLGSLARYGMRARDPRGKPLMATNPLHHIERPQKQRPEKKMLYLAEVQKMLAVSIPPNEAVARTTWAESALRVSELCRLNVGDVSLGTRKQAILAVTVKGKGRAREKIQIELSPEATQQIQDWLLRRNLPGPDEPLLTNQRGERYGRSALYQAVLRWGAAAGITRTLTNPHAIRHLWNFLAREEGIDQVTRARLLNHADTRTLQAYDHVLPQTTAKAREQVRAVLKAGFGESPEIVPTHQNSLVDFLKSGRRLES